VISLPRPRLSPLLRLTFAVTSLCGLLVLLADMLLGAFPNREQLLIEQRRQVGESLAVQAATLLRAEQPELLRQTLEDAAARLPDARTVLLRRADGRVLVQAGAPLDTKASPLSSEASSVDQIVVPLQANGQRWGRLELLYHGPTGLFGRLARWLTEPLVATLLLVSVVGTTVIGLYLRRALQHLDPMAVIPERVQGAFDVMNEGVAVLDGQGRLLLANKAFRDLHPDADQAHAGQPLSALPWLVRGLPPEPSRHPWARTLAKGQPLTGLPLEITGADGRTRQLLVNTMPITDGQQRVQGCLTSFTDQTEIHLANTRLHETLTELQASRDQVQRQNEELLRIATRDPLTGCLNRRAFSEAYQTLFETAQRQGTALSCLVFDIDFFKRVNDTWGHGIGDRVIQEAARKLGDCARATDLVCRYGGEEFVMVMPGLDAEGARKVAERVRQRVEREAGPAVREVPDMVVTASIGVAALTPAVLKPSQMIDEADQALYAAKRSGRNRVVVSGDAVVAPAPAPTPAEAGADPA